MKSRILSILLIVMMLCAVLNFSMAEEDKVLTVLVQGGSPAYTAALNTAEGFEKLTGYKINVESVPYASVYEKLRADILANTGAYDVATLDILWLPELYEGLLEISDLYTDEMKADVMAGMLDGATYGGGYYGTPVWTNCKILMYRTDLFEDENEKAAFKEQYGYELRVPTTWQEYRDVAKFFTRDTDGDGTIDMYGTGVFGKTDGDTVCSWLELCVQAGARPVVMDDEGNVLVNEKPYVDALELLCAIKNEDQSCPPGAMEMASAEVSEMFYNGSLAMMLNWGHFYLTAEDPAASNVAGKVSTAPHLTGEAGCGAVPGPWYQVITKASTKQDIAKQYLQYMWDNNEEIMKAMGVAAKTSLFEEYGSKDGYGFLASIRGTLEGAATQNRVKTSQWTLIEEEALIPAVQKALMGEKTPQEALDEAKALIEELVN